MKKKEEKIEVTDEGIVKNSNAKEKFKKVIEKYKLQNPVKYEHKKAALEKQLANYQLTKTTMNKILVTVSAIALCSMIITGIVILKPVNVKVELPEYGALVGPDVYHALKVHGAFNWGGNALATTTTGTGFTLSGSDMANYGYIDNMTNTAAFTYTLPATSTMISLLPELGSSRKWVFHNATSSAITLTIAKGAGMDLISLTNADDVIDAGEWAELTCTQIYYRSADNENIMCIISELADSD